MSFISYSPASRARRSQRMRAEASKVHQASEGQEGGRR